MFNLFEKLKSGAKTVADSFKPGRYEVTGINVTCPHCKHYEFKEGYAQMNTAGMTFFKLDWLNRSVTTLTCSNCGRIQWFENDPEGL